MSIFKKKQTTIPQRRRETKEQSRATDADLAARYAFRRNRTLTGSASSQVSSSGEANAQLKSPRAKAHELVQKRRHLGAMFVLVMTSAAGALILMYELTAGVVVRAQDITVQLSPVYEKTIQEYLSRQPFERLRFVLDEHALADYMRTQTPEVSDIHVEGASGFGKSTFIVTMREPIAGWSIKGQHLYVDKTGTAFGRNYFAQPEVQIVDNSGIELDPGQAVASNRFLGFVGRVVGQVKTQGYEVQQVVIPAGTTRQVEIRLKNVPYPVKFSVDRAAGVQAEDMARSLRWLNARGVIPGYLDVRVSGRAFYK